MNSVSLEQEIGVTCDGFAELRVWLSPFTPAGEGATRFVLREAGSNRVVLDTSIAHDAISTDDWYRFGFEPDWTSAGKQYVLEILGPDALSGQAPQVLYTAHPEFDLGDLSENGQLLEEDIVLQHGCVTGLRKIWLTGTP